MQYNGFWELGLPLADGIGHALFFLSYVNANSKQLDVVDGRDLFTELSTLMKICGNNRCAYIICELWHVPGHDVVGGSVSEPVGLCDGGSESCSAPSRHDTDQ